MVISKVYYADILETEELNESVRGEGGFGHTGSK
jgi:dUTPase